MHWALIFNSRTTNSTGVVVVRYEHAFGTKATADINTILYQLGFSSGLFESPMYDKTSPICAFLVKYHNLEIHYTTSPSPYFMELGTVILTIVTDITLIPCLSHCLFQLLVLCTLSDLPIHMVQIKHRFKYSICHSE